MPTDEQMMWQVQTNDDVQAFAQLMKRWRRPINRLCARVTGDIHLAEDLCQETFTKVFFRRKQYRPKAKFSTWLWQIALNLCYSRLRKTQSRLDRQSDSACASNPIAFEAICEQPTPDQGLLAQEQAELVRQALLRLGEASRLILILRYCEGMKLCDVAAKLGIPEATAASRCAVALARLARTLERDLAPRGRTRL